MSKGLEALKTFLRWFDDEHWGLDEVIKETDEYKVIEKELKALEIVKEKFVNFVLLKEAKNVQEYNNGVYYFPIMRLTQDEFDLLKEVFECQK